MGDWETGRVTGSEQQNKNMVYENHKVVWFVHRNNVIHGI